MRKIALGLSDKLLSAQGLQQDNCRSFFSVGQVCKSFLCLVYIVLFSAELLVDFVVTNIT
ncbi:hypothetical protein HanPI659440_Chr06g0228331 [Helianthus annuus]|nr:hypothetical protein HanPI659440_Chr06g0228331 [Helianthus annuus]